MKFARGNPSRLRGRAKCVSQMCVRVCARAAAFHRWSVIRNGYALVNSSSYMLRGKKRSGRRGEDRLVRGFVLFFFSCWSRYVTTEGFSHFSNGRLGVDGVELINC